MNCKALCELAILVLLELVCWSASLGIVTIRGSEPTASIFSGLHGIRGFPDMLLLLPANCIRLLQGSVSLSPL